MPNFNELLNYFGKNIDHAGELQKTTMNQMMDRISMSNPERVGPRLPDVTPEEKEYSDALATGVMGSMAPVTAVAPTMLQMAKETAKKARDMDFAKQLANQTKAVKFDRIQKYLGK